MRCSRCGRDQDAEAFPRHPQMSRGRDPRCKDCHRVLYRERAGFARRVCYLEKTCRNCSELKMLAKFPKRQGAVDGRDSRCHACKSAERRQRERERATRAATA